jgi:hypothetical protein
MINGSLKIQIILDRSASKIKLYKRLILETAKKNSTKPKNYFTNSFSYVKINSTKSAHDRSSNKN